MESRNFNNHIIYKKLISIIKVRIISVVSGGFDPVHSGHISYLKAAKKQGQILVVALNSDKWLENKKGKFYEFY